MYVSLDRLEEAEAVYAESLAILTRRYGGDHAYGAFLRRSRSALHEKRQNFVAMREDLTEALRIGRGALGERHPFVADVHYRLGRLDQTEGHYESALVHLESAWQLQEASLAPDHPDLSATRSLLDEVRHQRQGRP